MQTRFSQEQLADPRTAEANTILRKCVHCGFCTATCPTYVLLGDELDSPRGRIYLMREMLETGMPPTKRVVTHIDRCLSCLACVTTCPASVDYMHLVDHARAYIDKRYKRPLADRLIRAALAGILPHPYRFHAALRLAALGRPLAPLLKLWRGTAPLAAMLAIAPRAPAIPEGAENVTLYPARGTRKGRVALLTGCVQPVLAPQINAASIRLFNRLGIEVMTPPDQGCCGALVHHMGREAAAREAARRNIDAWLGESDGAGLDAIIINASGCGTMVKDYGHLLARDPAYALKAARVAALACDISEYLDRLGMPTATPPEPGLRVAYHSACSLQHGQKVTEAPKRLLAGAGFEVLDVPEGHLCCGSAGVYNVLQPQIATALRDRKLDNIGRVAPDLVATGNIGCITQLATAATVPVVHTVELLDWATGGPRPPALRAGNGTFDR
jgi:glycolate oxidase iron-sulfur subunit